jgi:hypothetical protein
VSRQRRITGSKVDALPPRALRWDFGGVADGHIYLLRKGRDFDVEVESLAAAARRWARTHGYRLATRSEFDEQDAQRPKVGLYVRFVPRDAGER